jgi:threonine/homoserine/homoserine lactone efflux protein
VKGPAYPPIAFPPLSDSFRGGKGRTLSLWAAGRTPWSSRPTPPLGKSQTVAGHSPEGPTLEIAFSFVFGLALGFSLTIPPGPMNALIASQTVRSLRSGIITGFGAMSADLALGIVVYALRTVVDLSSIARGIYLVGAVVMVVFGIRLLRRGPSPGPETTAGIRTFSQAVLVGVTNPFQIGWWLTAGLAFAYLGGLVLFAGLFGAIAVWVVAFPYALHLGTRGRPGIDRAVVYASAAIMFVFAGYFAVLAA